MGSRVRALFALLVVASLAASPAVAASKKPTPKPSVKVSVKASAKPSVKTSAKPTAKSSASPTVTKKKVVKKKKRVPRKKIKVSPSPKAVWPPAGFSQQGEVYAKIPSAKELVGIVSADASLAKTVKDCEKFACGAVQAASETGCGWWEVTTNITGPGNKKLGVLTSIITSTKAQVIKTFFTISPELVADGAVGKVSALVCHHDPRDPALPLNEYKKAE